MELKHRTLSRPHLTVFAFFSALYLLLLGPLEIYLHNSHEFTSTPAELVSFLFALAILQAMLVMALLLVLPNMLKSLLVRVVAFMVIGFWLISNFLYPDYGQFDGALLNIEPRGTLAFVQTFVLFALLLVVARVGTRVLFGLTTIVFFAALASGIAGFSAYEEPEGQVVTAEFPESLTGFSPTRNVLHVVLDELGSELLNETLEQDKTIRESLDGFTVFSNALSVYPTTEMSIQAMMTGEVYRNEMPKRDFIKKMKKSNLGVKRLARKDFVLDSHSFCRRGVLHNCTNISLRPLGKGIAEIESLYLIDVFMFKASPDYLKPWIYNKEKWLLLGMSNFNDYLKFQSGVAHLLFEKFVDNVSVSKSTEPRYKLFHSLITHSPTTLYQNCGIRAQNEVKASPDVQFAQCGLGHFVRLLQRLKDLGVYDRTLIVLSADHGGYHPYRGMDLQAWHRRDINPQMGMRAAAALAVKPFRASGPVRISQAPVSLRDIPHTILAANGLRPGKQASKGTRDILSVGESDDRTREFLFYQWQAGDRAKETLPRIKAMAVRGHRNDPESWSYR
ncbi:MAG: hypothetical protein GY922_15870 [Proteobacteria bacterium]|nr:hypothetical protein [Pseudomonadota bacterium]